MTVKNKMVFYKDADRILVAVDCIIFGFDKGILKLLLFKRKVNPFKNEWSLIGSFVKKNEGVAEAAARVLYESTGLERVFLNELICFGNEERDPGGRVISITHYALIRLNDNQERSVQEYEAQWFDVNEIPELILDHSFMVQKALERLKEHARFHPIGFELLPKKFTIPQLQLLYECIYRQPLDRRNFRKKILSMKILKKLAEKDKTGSKKGAFLYQFDKLKYKELTKRDFIFEI